MCTHLFIYPRFLGRERRERPAPDPGCYQGAHGGQALPQRFSEGAICKASALGYTETAEQIWGIRKSDVLPA